MTWDAEIAIDSKTDACARAETVLASSQNLAWVVLIKPCLDQTHPHRTFRDTG